MNESNRTSEADSSSRSRSKTALIAGGIALLMLAALTVSIIVRRRRRKRQHHNRSRRDHRTGYAISTKPRSGIFSLLGGRTRNSDQHLDRERYISHALLGTHPLNDPGIQDTSLSPWSVSVNNDNTPTSSAQSGYMLVSPYHLPPTSYPPKPLQKDAISSSTRAPVSRAHTNMLRKEHHNPPAYSLVPIF
jgi:hypothetical protein